MIDWKPFDIEKVTEQGNYLVTDGRSYDIATFSDYGGDEAEWFLSERTRIDGANAVTHYAKLNFPNGEE